MATLTAQAQRLDHHAARLLARAAQQLPGVHAEAGEDEQGALVTFTHGGERAVVRSQRVASLALAGLQRGTHRAALWQPVPLDRAKLVAALRARIAHLEQQADRWAISPALATQARGELAWVREHLAHLEEGGWE